MQILSFLGAIHWGLEYAGYGGYHSYRRYAFGVIAPAVAWPTMLMPIEYALITQFLAFNFLYFADTRATVRGWAPPAGRLFRRANDRQLSDLRNERDDALGAQGRVRKSWPKASPLRVSTTTW